MLRLNEAERAILEDVAEDMALGLSETMRQCIRAEAKRRGVPIPRPKTKRGRR